MCGSQLSFSIVYTSQAGADFVRRTLISASTSRIRSQRPSDDSLNERRHDMYMYTTSSMKARKEMRTNAYDLFLLNCCKHGIAFFNDLLPRLTSADVRPPTRNVWQRSRREVPETALLGYDSAIREVEKICKRKFLKIVYTTMH